MKKFAGYFRSALSLLVTLAVAALAKQLGLIAVAVCLPILSILALYGGRNFVNRGFWRIWVVLSTIWILVGVGISVRGETFQNLIQVHECPARFQRIDTDHAAYDDAFKALQPWEQFQVTDMLAGKSLTSTQPTEAAKRVVRLIPTMDSVDFWCDNTVGRDTKPYIAGTIIGLAGLFLGPIFLFALAMVTLGWIGAGFRREMH